MMPERLQKVLSRRGIASRRHAEDLISQGRVLVNGSRAKLGQTVTADDVIEVDGRILEDEGEVLYLALNKPTGFVTSLRTTHGEPTVHELIPDNARVFPVGRLDKETSGLLLLTNDGDWANLVTHPRYEIEKEYRAIVQRTPREEDLNLLRRGVQLRDGTQTAPARIRVARSRLDRTELSVTVIEGKKRQIRQMFAAIGHPVAELTRVRIGTIRTTWLQEGRWRLLEPEEVEGIRERARKVADRGERPQPLDSD